MNNRKFERAITIVERRFFSRSPLPKPQYLETKSKDSWNFSSSLYIDYFSRFYLDDCVTTKFVHSKAGLKIKIPRDLYFFRRDPTSRQIIANNSFCYPKKTNFNSESKKTFFLQSRNVSHLRRYLPAKSRVKCFIRRMRCE